jgi:hypothetical protein
MLSCDKSRSVKRFWELQVLLKKMVFAKERERAKGVAAEIGVCKRERESEICACSG